MPGASLGVRNTKERTDEVYIKERDQIGSRLISIMGSGRRNTMKKNFLISETW